MNIAVSSHPQREASHAQRLSFRRAWATPTLLTLAAIAALVIGLLPLFATPQVVPASAPASDFSAERALAHSRALFAQPHPLGSAAHAAAGQYIVTQLQSLGLQPEVQRTTTVDQDNGPATAIAGRVENIVARIPGAGNQGALLLAARYDTVATTPSASDAGLSAVTVLETVRALRAGPRLRNDVIVLFFDSEVNALLGSRAFAQKHPWMKDVALAFEFNAIGDRGPSLLVYNSPGEPWLFEQALAAAPHPRAYSFTADLFKILGGAPPDLSSFVDAGSLGLDFMNVNRPQVYHSMLDNPDNLDAGTIQQDGSYLLSLARHFGNVPLGQSRGQGTPLIAFTVWPDVVVRYPSFLALPLALAATLGFIVLTIVGVRRKQVRVAGLLAGAGIGLLAVAAAALLAVAVWSAIKGLNPTGHPYLGGRFYGVEYYYAGLVALAVAAVAGAFALARRLGVVALTLGALLWWLVLAWSSALASPGFSYVFVWPLLAGLAAVALFGSLQVQGGAGQGAAWRTAGLAATLLLIVVPLAAPIAFFCALAAKFEISGRPMVVLPVLLAALGTIPALPHVSAIARQRFTFPLAALAGCAILFAAGTAFSTYNAERPRPTHIAYYLDTVTGQATWQSVNRQLDPWTQQFFQQGAAPGRVQGLLTGAVEPVPGFVGPAPVAALPAPAAVVKKDERAGDARSVKLHITSPRGAPAVQADFVLQGDIEAAAIDGEPVNTASIPAAPLVWHLVFVALPPEGIDVQLTLRPAGPIKLSLADISHGLPALPGFVVQPRPADAMPMPPELLDPTIVSKSFEF